MRKTFGFALALIPILALTSGSAMAQGRVVVVSGPPLYVPAAPVTTVYAAPMMVDSGVVQTSYVAPTAYIAPSPVLVRTRVPTRAVYTTSSYTTLPATPVSTFYSPAVTTTTATFAPVVPVRRVRVVVPRRVYRYGYLY